MPLAAREAAGATFTLTRDCHMSIKISRNFDSGAIDVVHTERADSIDGARTGAATLQPVSLDC